MLSNEQQALMDQSWDALREVGLDQLGFRHYKLLVEMGGDEIKKMFKYTHLDRQQKMLISTMKWMLNTKESNAEGLRRLALYHAHLGVTKSMLSLFGKALSTAMKETLGDGLTEEIQATWETTYSSISNAFCLTIDQYTKELSGLADTTRLENRKKEIYTQLRNYFRDTGGESFLALSDKEGSVYMSQYDRSQFPIKAHVRTMFRKKWVVLRGRYLYIQRSESTPPENVIDLGYSTLTDTSCPGTLASPSPFSFALTDTTGYTTFVLCRGDDEKEKWYEKLLQVLNRFSYLQKELPRSTGVLTISILGEQLEPKEFKEDDFEMLTLVGRGSFGKVYKVREIASGKIFAVKVLRKSVLKVENRIAELKSEKTILLNINHPFIVRLHASFQSQDRLFLLFTFLSGGELFYHMQQSADNHFSESKSRFYIAETALAVSYLHSSNIIHRDLKAENLVLDAEGHVALTDFGFAKMLGTDEVPPHQTCGTLAYMAPEIFVSSALGYGPEVDWWSLGILLFNMLTGCYPFLCKEAQETVRAITTSPLVFPDSPKLTEGAVDLVTQLLQKLPGNRMRSIECFKAHPWFKGFDWDACLRRELQPPFVPDSSGRNTKYFQPCDKGASLASLAAIEYQDDFRSFFDVHQAYLEAGEQAAQKGTEEALQSKLDIPGLLTPGDLSSQPASPIDVNTCYQPGVQTDAVATNGSENPGSS